MKRNWHYIYIPVVVIVIVSVPFIIQNLMSGKFNVTLGGSNDGWLGFWGGYLGAILSVFGVYFQVTKEVREQRVQYNQSKFPKVRIVVGTITLHEISPKIIQMYPGESDRDRINRYRSFTRIWRDSQKEIAGISFANISLNRFYDAIVIIDYSPFEAIEQDGTYQGRMIQRNSDKFAIPEMGESSEQVAILFVSYLWNAYFDNSIKKKSKRSSKLGKLLFMDKPKQVK